jgi:flagellar hook-associated protein 2
MSSSSALSALLGSSNAVDISSILEALTGSSSSGIDVTSAVNAAVSAAQTPETQWENQQSTLASQTSALTALQTDINNLDNDMQSLNSLTGPLSAATVTSSNSTIISASASSGAASGNNIVEVDNLATTASWSSGVVASSTTALPAETFTITPASGTASTFTTDGTQTLSDLATEINSAGIGVSANVVTDATGSRLSIVAGSSGAASNFTVSSSDSAAFGLTQSVIPTNASLKVNGISISSASNTVTGVLPGLTLNLLSASAGTQVTLAVAPNTSAVTNAIQQFVTDYNTAMSALNTQFTDTNNEGEGVLSSDPTVRNLQSQLLDAISYTYTPSAGTTTVPNLTSLGVSVNKDGTLSLNTTTLDSALSNNYSDVQSFFQGTALNGFASTVDQQLTSFISPADGAFTVDLSSLSTEYNNLQDDINNFQSNVIAPLKVQLQSEYSNAEIALQELPGEIKNIDAELGLNNSSSN